MSETQPLSAEYDAGQIEAKIEASSLGTPEAKALRDTVSDEHAARIVQRAKELGEVRCACGHDQGDHSANGACRFWCHTSADFPGKVDCARDGGY